MKNILLKIQTILLLMRVKQWSKNVIVFIPIFFSGNLLIQEDFIRTGYAFIVLCLLTSSVYIFNDIFDISHDRAHPVKKHRPIASGKVSVAFAIILAIILFLASLITNILLIASEYLLILQVIYFLLMISYSIWLKHIPIIDALVISGGFLLRVLVGAIILQLDISAMLALSVIGGALLISYGKRVAEFYSLSPQEVSLHRPALAGYSQKALDSIVSSIVAITFFAYVLLCYDFYKLYLDSRIVDLLPPTMRDSQWLMITVPLAFYGLFRYLNLIYNFDKRKLRTVRPEMKHNNSNEYENCTICLKAMSKLEDTPTDRAWEIHKGTVAQRPEELWFKDKPLFMTLIIWVLTLFVLIYFKDVFAVFKMLIHLF